MLNLLAADFEDGWAFVEHNQRIFLLRPPYRINHGYNVVPETVVHESIYTHGFVAMEKCFTNWSELIDFLKKQLVESRKASEQNVPNSETIRSLVKYAPPHVLDNYLDRIELEL